MLHLVNIEIVLTMNGVVISREWSSKGIMLADRERRREREKKKGKSQRSKMAAERNLT